MFENNPLKRKSIESKYAFLIIVCFITIVIVTNCSVFDNKNESIDDISKSISVTGGALDLSDITNQEFEQKLLNIANTNIEIQNGMKNIELNTIYTDAFIQKTINGSNNFYRKLKIEMDPMAKYNEENDEYIVIVWLTDNRNAVVLEQIIIKQVSSGELKISDIQ